MSVLLLLEFVSGVLPWLGPLVVSTLTGAGAGFGAFRFKQGAVMQRLTTLERDTGKLESEQEHLVTRNEFDLLREDLREIRTDVREIRRFVSR